MHSGAWGAILRTQRGWACRASVVGLSVFHPLHRKCSYEAREWENHDIEESDTQSLAQENAASRSYVVLRRCGNAPQGLAMLGLDRDGRDAWPG